MLSQKLQVTFSQKHQVSTDNIITSEDFLMKKQRLQLSYRNIEIIDKITPQYYNVSYLYLNHNKIKSLTGIEQFKNLEALYIKFNCIENIDELFKIHDKNKLKILDVKGNPIDQDKNCNFEYLQKIFKNLQQFNDNVTLSSQFEQNNKKQIVQNNNKISNNQQLQQNKNNLDIHQFYNNVTQQRMGTQLAQQNIGLNKYIGNKLDTQQRKAFFDKELDLIQSNKSILKSHIFSQQQLQSLQNSSKKQSQLLTSNLINILRSSSKQQSGSNHIQKQNAQVNIQQESNDRQKRSFRTNSSHQLGKISAPNRIQSQSSLFDSDKQIKQQYENHLFQQNSILQEEQKCRTARSQTMTDSQLQDKQTFQLLQKRIESSKNLINLIDSKCGKQQFRQQIVNDSDFYQKSQPQSKQVISESGQNKSPYQQINSIRNSPSLYSLKSFNNSKQNSCQKIGYINQQQYQQSQYENNQYQNNLQSSSSSSQQPNNFTLNHQQLAEIVGEDNVTQYTSNRKSKYSNSQNEEFNKENINSQNIQNSYKKQEVSPLKPLYIKYNSNSSQANNEVLSVISPSENFINNNNIKSLKNYCQNNPHTVSSYQNFSTEASQKALQKYSSLQSQVDTLQQQMFEQQKIQEVMLKQQEKQLQQQNLQLNFSKKQNNTSYNQTSSNKKKAMQRYGSENIFYKKQEQHQQLLEEINQQNDECDFQQQQQEQQNNTIRRLDRQFAEQINQYSGQNSLNQLQNSSTSSLHSVKRVDYQSNNYSEQGSYNSVPKCMQIQNNQENSQSSQQHQEQNNSSKCMKLENPQKFLKCLDDSDLFSSVNLPNINQQITAKFAKQNDIKHKINTNNNDSLNLNESAELNSKMNQPKKQKENLQTSNNNPLDSQMNLELSFDQQQQYNNEGSKSSKNGSSNTQSSDQGEQQQQSSQQNQQMMSLNLSRITQINQRSLTNISIPQLKLECLSTNNINFNTDLVRQQANQKNQSLQSYSALITEDSSVDIGENSQIFKKHVQGINRDVMSLSVMYNDHQIQKKTFLALKNYCQQLKQQQQSEDCNRENMEYKNKQNWEGNNKNENQIFENENEIELDYSQNNNTTVINMQTSMDQSADHQQEENKSCNTQKEQKSKQENENQLSFDGLYDEQAKVATAVEYYENYLKIKVISLWKVVALNRANKRQMVLNLQNLRKEFKSLNSARDTQRTRLSDVDEPRSSRSILSHTNLHKVMQGVRPEDKINAQSSSIQQLNKMQYIQQQLLQNGQYSQMMTDRNDFEISNSSIDFSRQLENTSRLLNKINEEVQQNYKNNNSNNISKESGKIVFENEEYDKKEIERQIFQHEEIPDYLEIEMQKRRLKNQDLPLRPTSVFNNIIKK